MITQIEMQIEASLIISFLALLISAATFVLRLQDRRTDFVVDATYDDKHGTLVLTVINNGQGEATLSRLFLGVYRDGKREGTKDLTGSFFKGTFDLPKRLLSKDRIECSVEKSFLHLQLKAQEYEDGMYELEPAAEDGQGKKHIGERVRFES